MAGRSEPAPTTESSHPMVMGMRVMRITAGIVMAACLIWTANGSWESQVRATSESDQKAAGEAPTFYCDVLPILQRHCESCHRAEGIPPRTFGTNEETRQFAAEIRNSTQNKSMPPWFAVAGIGHFSNDPSLTAEQI